MFSKTGRITTEQHTIFNRKDHILENKIRYLRVSSFPAFERDLEQLALVNGTGEKPFDFEEAIPKYSLDEAGAHLALKTESAYDNQLDSPRKCNLYFLDCIQISLETKIDLFFLIILLNIFASKGP